MQPSESAPPSIFADRSFWGMTITQFLAVFNDNFYKQIVMFICIDAAMTGGSQGLQGLGIIVFSLPFILFSGFCGYLSDLFSKRTIIVASKIAEILIMFIGLYGFLKLDITALFIVLFLMGVHSALYGPAKYGLLPELFTERQLPKVNGLFQMTMFLAIILGLASSGIVTDQLRGDAPVAAVTATETITATEQSPMSESPSAAATSVADPASTTATTAPLHRPLQPGKIWIAAVICMVLAGAGFFSSLLIRKMPAAKPGMPFDRSDLILNKETRRLLWADKKMMGALAATSAFWATGGLIYPSAINDLGKQQFHLNDAQTGYMAAGTGLGIAVGCVLGMLLSRNRFNARLIRVGGIGMLLGLILLAIPGSGPTASLLGIGGSAVILVWLGVCAGLYNVPLQVFIQAHAPADHKGRVIGAMNLANWIGIYSSGIIYMVINPLIIKFGGHSNLLFGVGALFLVPVVLYYRPQSENLSDHVAAH